MDIFSLAAKLTLDKSGYESGLGEAKEHASAFASKLKSGLATAAKIGVAAIGAASTGIAMLTKQSVEQYAEYEQLVGGVETLFKGSAGKVQEYAANAYRTAGLSANEYMATVTSFSASLLQSLGGNTERAAEMADMAITDMSDNANKMGTDMASIQNAYNGFAKQNYTMLDNLKLGYGGTKQEMERLLADAQKLTGLKFDISSYADIVQAIHVVQTEMEITGTTAKEASETISGSINMLKSAWANLVTGLGNENANFDQLVSNVVESAVTAGNNLIPRIEYVLMGIATLIEQLAPVIAEKFPGLVQKILPPLLNAAQSLLEALVQASPELIKALIAILPGLVEMLINTIADMSPELIDLGVSLIIALAEGLIVAIPNLVDRAPEIVMSLIEALIRNAPRLVEAGIKLLAALGQGIIVGAAYAVRAVLEIGSAIAGAIGDLIKNAWEWGKDLILNFWNGIVDFVSYPIRAISDMLSNIFSMIHFSEPDEGPLSDFHTYAPDMMKEFARGITDNAGLVEDAISNAFNFGTRMTGSVPVGETIVPRETAGIGSQMLNIILELDGVQFARAIYNANKKETQRLGVQLSEVVF